VKEKLLILSNLVKIFDGHRVLNNLSLEIEDGEFITLLGPSGCGKTTLLRIIGGFESVDEGELFLKQQPLLHVPPHKRAINTVFQSYALFPHMRVDENIAFGLKMKRIPLATIQEEVSRILEVVKLTPFAHKMPHELSGGQQQRVAIARAIVNKPSLLLLDEPLSALDYKLRKAMQIELKALQRQLGITFIFVTHDQEEALSMSDRIVVMNHGNIEQIGTPKEVYENPKTLFVADFIGQTNQLKATLHDQDDQTLHLQLADQRLILRKNEPKTYAKELVLIVRPEDFRVERRLEDVPTKSYLEGVLQQIIYKGVTIDLVIQTNQGETVNVSEFYNEDSDALSYQEGERLYLYWNEGWEVILDA